MIDMDLLQSLKSLPLELQIFLVLAFGLCVGSFLNVVIYRLPRSKSVIRPSSRCGFCRSSISAWMNIPVLSFMFTEGRCRSCGYAFSVRYPIVEVLNAILFYVVWNIHGWNPNVFIFWTFSSLLLSMSFIDLEFRIIPDVLSVGGWALAIFVALVGNAYFPVTIGEAILGSLFGYISFWCLSRLYSLIAGEEGLGGGDVKLMGLIGAVLGFRGVLTTILLGSLLGSIVGVVMILLMKKSRKFPIPFGPFLAVGAYAAMFRLDELWWP